MTEAKSGVNPRGSSAPACRFAHAGYRLLSRHLASDSNEGIDWTDGRRARRGDPRHAVNVAKDPAQPAAHLGALIEIQPAERIVVAARQRTAHDVAQRDRYL